MIEECWIVSVGDLYHRVLGKELARYIWVEVAECVCNLIFRA